MLSISQTEQFYNNICGRTNCVYYFNLNDLKHFAAGHSYSQVPGDLVTTSWMQFKIKATYFSLHWNIVAQIMQLGERLCTFKNLTTSSPTSMRHYIMNYWGKFLLCNSSVLKSNTTIQILNWLEKNSSVHMNFDFE